MLVTGPRLSIEVDPPAVRWPNRSGDFGPVVRRIINRPDAGADHLPRGFVSLPSDRLFYLLYHVRSPVSLVNKVTNSRSCRYCQDITYSTGKTGELIFRRED